LRLRCACRSDSHSAHRDPLVVVVPQVRHGLGMVIHPLQVLLRYTKRRCGCCVCTCGVRGSGSRGVLMPGWGHSMNECSFPVASAIGVMPVACWNLAHIRSQYLGLISIPYAILFCLCAANNVEPDPINGS